MAVSHPKTRTTTDPARTEHRHHAPAWAAWSAWSAWSAAGAAVALAVVVAADQFGAQRLADHAAALYTPYGRRADPALLYGLVYTVAAVDVVLALPVIRAVRAGRRWAPVLAAASAVVAAGLAVTLLAVREYGQAVFPPVWGALALLPAAAGTVTAVLLVRRRP